MRELKIDPELRDLLPPLTSEEYKQLEKNIDSFVSSHYSMGVIRNRFRAEILGRPIREYKKASFFHRNNRIHFYRSLHRESHGTGEKHYMTNIHLSNTPGPECSLLSLAP